MFWVDVVGGVAVCGVCMGGMDNAGEGGIEGELGTEELEEGEGDNDDDGDEDEDSKDKEDDEEEEDESLLESEK